MNRVILSGRLTRDPHVCVNTEESKVVRYSLAVDKPGRNEKDKADFIDCVAFGKNAEFAGKYFHKGSRILLEGRISTGSYVNHDGAKVLSYSVIVDLQEFAGAAPKTAHGSDTAVSSEFLAMPEFMAIPENGMDYLVGEPASDVPFR